MKYLLLYSLLSLVSAVCSAQTITIKKLELAGDKIIVIYDLDDSNPANNYLINLYTSRDNYSMPVKSVTGDIGLEVKPGTDRRIVWKIMDDYGSYKGRLSLELRGRIFMPFIKIDPNANNKSYKRGKNYEFKWTPGNNNPLSIELYKGNQRISGDVNQPNNGSYNLYIPAHAAKGKDYRIRIFDMRSPDEAMYSQNFAVKPKIPLALKALPVLVVGGVLALILKDNPDEKNNIEDPDFPTQ